MASVIIMMVVVVVVVVVADEEGRWSSTNAEQTGRPRLQSPPATGVACRMAHLPLAPGWRFAVRAAGYRRCDAKPRWCVYRFPRTDGLEKCRQARQNNS